MKENIQDDIHHNRKHFESTKRNIVTKFSEENSKIILDFLEACKIRGKSYARLTSYGDQAIMIFKLYNNTTQLNKFTKSDVEQIVSKIRDSNYAGNTKMLMALTLKRLVHFALHREIIEKNLDAKKDYDDMVDWVTPTRFMDKWDKIQAKDLLTDQEILDLITATKKRGGKYTKRNIAMLFCLLEGAYRPAELLQIKIGGVEFFDDHLKIYTHGKTGPKTLTLVSSYPAIKEWISEHPKSDDLESWLWWQNNEEGRVSYTTFRLFIKRVAKESGLKKRVWTYLFRHTALTQYSKKLGNVAKVYGNWSSSSTMLSRYEHLADSDQANSILALHGLKKNDDSQSILFSKICERCKERNSADKSHCSKCGNILSKKLAQEREARKMDSMKKLEKKFGNEILDMKQTIKSQQKLFEKLLNERKD